MFKCFESQCFWLKKTGLISFYVFNQSWINALIVQRACSLELESNDLHVCSSCLFSRPVTLYVQFAKQTLWLLSVGANMTVCFHNFGPQRGILSKMLVQSFHKQVNIVPIYPDCVNKEEMVRIYSVLTPEMFRHFFIWQKPVMVSTDESQTNT